MDRKVNYIFTADIKDLRTAINDAKRELRSLKKEVNATLNVSGLTQGTRSIPSPATVVVRGTPPPAPGPITGAKEGSVPRFAGQRSALYYAIDREQRERLYAVPAAQASALQAAVARGAGATELAATRRVTGAAGSKYLTTAQTAEAVRARADISSTMAQARAAERWGTTLVDLRRKSEALGISVDEFIRKKRGATTVEDINTRQLEKMNRQLALTEKETRKSNTAFTEMWRVVRSLTVAFVGFRLLRYVQEMGRHIVEFQSKMEQVRIAISDILTSQGRMVNKLSGDLVPLGDQIAVGFGVADEALHTLIEDAVKLGVPIDQVMQSFTKIYGIASKANVSFGDTIKIMEALTMISQRTGLPFRQLTKSIDNIFTGLRVSQTEIGTMLGLTGPLIAKEKERGTLAQFLLEKLQGVTLNLNLNANTLEGIRNSLRSTFDAFSMAVGGGAFEILKQATRDMQQWVDNLRKSPEHVAELREKVTNFAKDLYGWMKFIVEKARQFSAFMVMAAEGYAGLRLGVPLLSMAYGARGSIAGVAKRAWGVVSGEGGVAGLVGRASTTAAGATAAMWITRLASGLAGMGPLALAGAAGVAVLAIAKLVDSLGWFSTEAERRARELSQEADSYSRLSPAAREARRSVAGSIATGEGIITSMRRTMEAGQAAGGQRYYDTRMGRTIAAQMVKQYSAVQEELANINARAPEGFTKDERDRIAALRKDAAQLYSELIQIPGLMADKSKEYTKELKQITSEAKQHVRLAEDNIKLSVEQRKLGLAQLDGQQKMLELRKQENELHLRSVQARFGLGEAIAGYNFAMSSGARSSSLRMQEERLSTQMETLDAQKQLAAAMGASERELLSYEQRRYELERQMLDIRRQLQAEAVELAKSEKDAADRKVLSLEYEKSQFKPRQDAELAILDLEIKQAQMRAAIAAEEEKAVTRSIAISDNAIAAIGRAQNAKLLASWSTMERGAQMATGKGTFAGWKAWTIKTGERLESGELAQAPDLFDAAAYADFKKAEAAKEEMRISRAEQEVRGIQAKGTRVGAEIATEIARGQRRIAPQRQDTEYAEFMSKYYGAATDATKAQYGLNEAIDKGKDFLEEGRQAALRYAAAMADLKNTCVDLGASMQEMLADLAMGGNFDKIIASSAEKSGREWVEKFLKQKLHLDDQMKVNFLEYFPQLGEKAGELTGRAFGSNAGQFVQQLFGGGAGGGPGTAAGGLGGVGGQIGSAVQGLANMAKGAYGTVSGWFSGGAPSPGGETAVWPGAFSEQSVQGVGEVNAQGQATTPNGTPSAGAVGANVGAGLQALFTLGAATYMGKRAVDQWNKNPWTKHTDKKAQEEASYGFLKALGIGPIGSMLAKPLSKLGPAGSALGGAAAGAMLGTMVLPGLGTAIGAVIGSIAGLFVSLLSQKKTSGVYQALAFKQLFKEAGIPVIGGQGGGNIRNIPIGGIGTSFGPSAALLPVPGAYGGQMTGEVLAIGKMFQQGMGWSLPGRNNLPQSTANAIINTGMIMGLSAEDTLQMARAFGQKAAGGDFTKGLYTVAARRQSQWKRGRVSQGAADKTFVDAVQGLIVSFNDLPPAIDTARVALGVFDREGRIQIKGLQRAIEDVNTVIAQGIPNALKAGLSSGSVLDSAESLAKTYADTFNSRLADRLLTAPDVGQALTDSTMLYQKAIDAMMAGRTAEANRYLAQARTSFMSGQQTFMSYANTLIPWASGYTSSLGVYSGGAGIQNQTGAGISWYQPEASFQTPTAVRVPGAIGSPLVSVVHGGETVRSPGQEDRIAEGLSVLSAAQREVAAAFRVLAARGAAIPEIKVVIAGETIQAALTENIERDGGGRGVRTPDTSIGVVG